MGHSLRQYCRTQYGTVQYGMWYCTVHAAARTGYEIWRSSIMMMGCNHSIKCLLQQQDADPTHRTNETTNERIKERASERTNEQTSQANEQTSEWTNEQTEQLSCSREHPNKKTSVLPVFVMNAKSLGLESAVWWWKTANDKGGMWRTIAEMEWVRRHVCVQTRNSYTQVQ